MATNRIRRLLGLCIAIDLVTLALFWTPTLFGYELWGWLGSIQSQVTPIASPLLVPLLIVLFVIVTIREPSAS